MLQERLRDREAERLRGLEVDDELEFGRQLHRQFAGFGALEDEIDVRGCSAVEIGQIDAVGNKTSGRREDPIWVDSRQLMPSRQREERVPLAHAVDGAE